MDITNNELHLFDEETYCENCDRMLPNKNFKTKNGCVWCDNLYKKELPINPKIKQGLTNG